MVQAAHTCDELHDDPSLEASDVDNREETISPTATSNRKTSEQ